MTRMDYFRDFPKSLASLQVAFSVVVFVSISQMAIYMGFAPGWSNEWPGISQQTVFGAFMSAAFLAVFLSGGIAVAAFPCFLLQQRVRRDYTGWFALTFFLLFWAAIGGYITGWSIYPNVRTWVN
jgi:hypothetical protein